MRRAIRLLSFPEVVQYNMEVTAQPRKKYKRPVVCITPSMQSTCHVARSKRPGVRASLLHRSPVTAADTSSVGWNRKPGEQYACPTRPVIGAPARSPRGRPNELALSVPWVPAPDSGIRREALHGDSQMSAHSRARPTLGPRLRGDSQMSAQSRARPTLGPRLRGDSQMSARVRAHLAGLNLCASVFSSVRGM